MNYERFITQVPSPVFGQEVCLDFWKSRASCKLQLNRWKNAGKVIPLKRDLYTLPSHRNHYNFSMDWLANTLYSPSYLSLEHALSWYGMIPERVEAFTSVSILKTKTFKNSLGTFTYKHVKDNLFFGFEERKDEHGSLILMATPEKALLDFIYLHPHFVPRVDFFEENMRLQQTEQLRKSYLEMYRKKFDSPKMDKAVSVIIELLNT